MTVQNTCRRQLVTMTGRIGAEPCPRGTIPDRRSEDLFVGVQAPCFECQSAFR